MPFLGLEVRSFLELVSVMLSMLWIGELPALFLFLYWIYSKFRNKGIVATYSWLPTLLYAPILLPLVILLFELYIKFVGIGIRSHRRTMWNFIVDDRGEPLSTLSTFAPSKTSRKFSSNLFEMSTQYKEYLNHLPAKYFREARFHKIREGPKKMPGIASRGYYKFRAMENALDWSRINTVVDLCAGAGGWTQRCLEKKSNIRGMALSLWGKEGHQNWGLNTENVKLLPGNIHHVLPERGYDLILMDGGEKSGNVLEEARRTSKFLSTTYNWLTINPQAQFILKVHSPSSQEVVDEIQKIRALTGKGELVRNPSSRNSNIEMYLISIPPSPGDLSLQISRKIYEVLSQLDEGVQTLYNGGSVLRDTYSLIDSVDWCALVHKGLEDCPKLPAFNGSNISKLFYTKTSGLLRFYREIGSRPYREVGNDAEFKNPFIYSLLHKAHGTLKGLTIWKATDTGAKKTFEMVQSKLDKEPIENHAHYRRLRASFDGISRFLRCKQGWLRRYTAEDLQKIINRQASMGEQERHLGYSCIGEYFDSGTWRQNVTKWIRALRNDAPYDCEFNSMGKKERKEAYFGKAKASRLIWFMCGTARLAEQTILGSLYDVLKKLPTSVSGMPLYDYGERMKELDKDGWNYVADDVAAWDAKVSVGDLRMECEFLQTLARDPALKNDIEKLYSIYANKKVILAFHNGESNGQMLVQTRGQRGSGEVTTYGMNTILNTAINLARSAYSNNIPEDRVSDYAFNFLIKQEEKVGEEHLLVSGDDCIYFSSPEKAKKFAVDGGVFMDEIGKPRKGIVGPSEIYESLQEVPFCSHYFRDVEFRFPEGSYYRAMPYREISEIFSKAAIMVHRAKELSTCEAWARAQAFNMLINYPHISEVSFLASALLSCTSTRISLQSMVHPGMHSANPWLTCKTALEAINKCLFGDGTSYPVGGRIIDLSKDIVFVRRSFTRPVHRASWKKSLGPISRAIKNLMIGSWGHDNHDYENLITEAMDGEDPAATAAAMKNFWQYR